MSEDAELLRCYVEEKSEAAFAELVRRHLDFVYAVALRRLGGDAHGAEDVAQQVFTAAARQAPKLVDHPVLNAWLYTATRRTAAQTVRANRRRQVRELEAQMIHDNPVSPDWTRFRPVLDDALDDLRDKDRQAVLLRFFDGKSFAEVGSQLQLSDDAARLRVHRALEKLHQLLARRGFTSTAGAVGVALAESAAAAPAGLAATISGNAIAAVSAAPGLGLIAFMTAQKSAAPAGIAALLGVLSIGLGVYQWQKSADLNLALDLTVRRHDAGLVQLHALERDVEAADEALAGVQRDLATRQTPTRAPRPATPATNAIRLTLSKEERNEFQAQFPEVRAIELRNSKAQLAMHYRLFFEQAGLTPTQVDEFLTRTAEEQVKEASLSPGFKSPQYATSQLPAEQLRTMLGDEAFQKFEAFTRLLPMMDDVDSVRIFTSEAGVMISADQEVRLAQIVADNSQEHRDGKILIPTSVDWASVIAQAQRVLSPQQWRVAESVFLNHQYQQAVTLALGPSPIPEGNVNPTNGQPQRRYIQAKSGANSGVK